MANAQRKPDMTLYERDFHAWANEQAAALRARRFDQIDIDNVVEELETLGRSERHAIENRLEVLLAHLLKWAYQGHKRYGSWRGTIIEQRKRIAKLLRENPSLKHVPQESLTEVHELARIVAANDSGLDAEAFPADCPFTIDQILDESFWPEPAG
ncbi:MAG TPA: DUF29 domain-containing protein [Rhizobiaceae bacterium]|nr:DUF29 domain-containing protein [Rhizobiaceae bacterium]